MRRFFIISAGFSVLAVGLVMTVLPGPAILVIPAGLGILAKELGWARTALEKTKNAVEKTKARLF